MEMGIIAMIIGVFLGLILGIAAATKQNTWVDYTTTVISVIAVSVPSFVLAVLLQYVFAVRLKMVPSSRMGRYFNSSITFTCIIRRCDGNCSKVYSSRNDRSIKFRLHIISKSKRNSSMRVLFGHALKMHLYQLLQLLYQC